MGPLDETVEIGTVVVIVGLWDHPHLNGRVAIVSKTGDGAGLVDIALREQYSNEVLFFEVEELPTVGLLKNVPIGNLVLHTTSRIDTPPPPRPRWSKQARARPVIARPVATRAKPVLAKRFDPRV